MANKKRLIDANDVYSLFDRNGTARLHVADIDAIPRVDAVEAVRCKDCRRSGVYTSGKLYCKHQYGLTDPKPDDFCSYGERRE